MICYCDSSALVKLYIEEKHSELMEQKIIESDIVSCSVITFVECIAAFARLEREQIISSNERDNHIKDFIEEWNTLNTIELTTTILKRSAKFPVLYGLKGADSLQLATAEDFFLRVNKSVLFISFDSKLRDAAKDLGFAVLDFN